MGTSQRVVNSVILCAGIVLAVLAGEIYARLIGFEVCCGDIQELRPMSRQLWSRIRN